MKTIKLRIDQSVLARYPETRVAALVVHSLDPQSGVLEVGGAEQAAVLDRYARDGITIQNLSDHRLIAPWRSAARDSGLKASTFKSSAEQLARRLLQGAEVSAPLTLVRRYCYRSALHLAPLGGYDASALPTSDIVLREAVPGRDTFTPLGGKSADFVIAEKVVVYACDSTVLCWSFNHRDAFNTRLTATTRTAIFFSEAITKEQFEASVAALEDLRTDLAASGAALSGILVTGADATLALEIGA